MKTVTRPLSVVCRCLLAALLYFTVAQGMAAQELAREMEFAIPSQRLADAILKFSEQTQVQIVTLGSNVSGLSSPGVSGKHRVEDALRLMLQGTGLTFNNIDGNTVSLVHASASTAAAADAGLALRLAQLAPPPAAAQTNDTMRRNTADTRKDDAAQSADESAKAGIPEVLVKGSRSLNMDIERTPDDIQPYVVIDRETIERSAATTLNDLLKRQLPMNAVATSASQDPSATTRGGRSSFNLRGLGADQTLILVDGRRLPLSFGSGTLQADTTGIPLAAIERVEILPTTAAGIYGGSATGGVINIIMRRGYRGSELGLNYENSFDSDVSQRRIDFSTGFDMEGGRTSFMLSASHSDANELFRKDRDFDTRGLARVIANNGGRMTAVDLYQFYPPLGATTNIRTTDGSNLVLKSGPALNSNITSVPAGYAGIASDGGAQLVANAGRYNLALADSAQYTWGSGNTSLLKLPEVNSVMASVRREFTPWLQVFLDASHSRVDSTNTDSPVSGYFSLAASAPGNPFNNSIVVNAPFAEPKADGNVEDRMTRAAIGLIFKLPRNWLMEADYTWGRSTHLFTASGSRMPSLTTDVTSGVINVFRDLSTLDISSYLFPSYFYTITPYVNRSDDFALRVSRPLMTLPGGTMTLSGMLGHRRDRSEEARTWITPNNFNLVPARHQNIDSAYAELNIPLISQANARPGIAGLELQAAVRTERYEIVGAPSTITLGSTPPTITNARNELSSTNPTLGLRYRPVPDIMLRASYSTGFQPPDFSQLSNTILSNVNGIGIPDPKRGNTFVGTFTAISGGNADLKPEDSVSRSAGIVFTPSFVPGLRASLDWFLIKKSDNITRLSQPIIVANEDLLPGRVIRGPKLSTDPADWAGPITTIDAGFVNVSKAELEGYDIRLDYALDTGDFGSYSAFLGATCQTHYKTQLVAGFPVVENIGTGASLSDTKPLKWKGNAGLTWSKNGLTLGWAAQFYDSYLVAVPNDPSRVWQLTSQGNGGRVPSQIFHDLMGSYTFSSTGRDGVMGWLTQGTEIRGGVKNVLNTRPAFYVDYNQGLLYNPYGDPRLAVYYLSLKKAF